MHFTGPRKQRVVDFMSNFVQGEQRVIDLAHVFSRTDNEFVATLGCISGSGFVMQLIIVLPTSVTDNHPSFFNIVQGCTCDVSAIEMTMKETGISGVYASLSAGSVSTQRETYVSLRWRECATYSPALFRYLAN